MKNILFFLFCFFQEFSMNGGWKYQLKSNGVHIMNLNIRCNGFRREIKKKKTTQLLGCTNSNQLLMFECSQLKQCTICASFHFTKLSIFSFFLDYTSMHNCKISGIYVQWQMAYYFNSTEEYNGWLTLKNQNEEHNLIGRNNN